MTRLLQAAAVMGLLSVVSLGCAAAEPEDEGGSGESTDFLLAGTRIAPSEVAMHLRNAGFPEDEIGRMVCTARWESNFYSRAQNRNKNGTIDRGLFQINSVNLTGRGGCPTRANVADLWDPATNAKCAYSIYKVLGNRAWYAYRKHQSECDSYEAPASATGSATSDSTSASHGDEDNPGGCYSSTLGDMVDAHECVQSRSNSVWYQCMDGGWYRGGDATTGPFGSCSSAHAL